MEDPTELLRYPNYQFILIFSNYNTASNREPTIGARGIEQGNRMFPTKGIAMKKGIKETTNSNAISSFLLGLICSNSHVTRASGKLGVSLKLRLQDNLLPGTINIHRLCQNRNIQNTHQYRNSNLWIFSPNHVELDLFELNLLLLLQRYRD